MFRRIVEHRIGWRSQGKNRGNNNKANSVCFLSSFELMGAAF